MGKLNVATVDAVMEDLHALAASDQLDSMSRYGMTVDNRLGIKIPVLRKLAKRIGRDHELALQLWDREIAEACILASMVDDPKEVTTAQMDDWARDFDSWDVCDQVCMNLFDKTPLASDKISEWARRDEEFVKRAGYALIACLAWHDKGAEDELFLAQLPIIVEGATDERNFVKKGVSWALRHIGKRSPALRVAALETASELQAMDSKSARWIGRDAVRDLNSQATLNKMNKLAEQGSR